MISTGSQCRHVISVTLQRITPWTENCHNRNGVYFIWITWHFASVPTIQRSSRSPIQVRDGHRQDCIQPRGWGSLSTFAPRAASVSCRFWHEYARPKHVRRPCSWWSPFPSTDCFWTGCSRSVRNAHEPSRWLWIWAQALFTILSTGPGNQCKLQWLVFLTF